MKEQKQEPKKVITPLGDRVLIERLSPEEVKSTLSGIIIPETVAKEKPIQGKVIAVGKGRVAENGTVVPMTVKKGDMVLFSKYSPDEIKVDGKEYIVVSEPNILAIIG